MSGSTTISDLFLNKELILRKSLSFFAERFSCALKIGVELEFYLLNKGKVALNSEINLDNFILLLAKYFQHDELIYLIEKEKGSAQIEVKFSPTSDLQFLAKKINDVKAEISEIAEKQGFFADFSAQNFLDDCGSAMQFNLSFCDENDKNLLLEDLNLAKKITASILKYASQMMIFCVQNDEDFLRFDVLLNKKLHKNGKFVAPTFICCGIDNRSALVRFFAANSKNAARVEFRLAGANCDATLILASLLFVLTQNVDFDEKLLVYGNAFDEKYDFKSLPKNFDEALAEFSGGELNSFLIKMASK
jgi:glutamine synthetase